MHSAVGIQFCSLSLSSNYSILSSLLEWGHKNFLMVWLPRLFTPTVYSQLLFMNKMASPYYAEYGFYCGVWVSLPITSDDEPFSSAAQWPHSHQSSFRSLSYHSLRSSLPSFEALRCLGKPMQVSHAEVGGKVKCPFNARESVSVWFTRLSL